MGGLSVPSCAQIVLWGRLPALTLALSLSMVLLASGYWPDRLPARWGEGFPMGPRGGHPPGKPGIFLAPPVAQLTVKRP